MYNKQWSGWIKHLDFAILDLFLLQASYVGADCIRHRIRNTYLIDTYMTGAQIIFLAALITMLLLDIHKNILKRSVAAELLSVLKLVGCSVLTLLVYLFFSKKSSDFSRIVVAYFAVIAVVSDLAGRLLWKKWLLSRRKRDTYNRRHMLLITDEEMAEDTVSKIKSNSLWDIQLIGLVFADGSHKQGETVDNIPVVASVENVIDYIRGIWLDEVMISIVPGTADVNEILDKCAVMGITTHFVLNHALERKVMQQVGKVAGCLVITESIRIASPWQLLLKRLMDICGGLVGLLITGILTVIVGPVIYFTDPGPIFFKQKRIGKNGRVFTMYKFRSMYQDAEQRKKELLDRNEINGLMFKVENDPRVLGSGPDGTRKGIGWFIRKTSIDEFPQFLAVLTGTLSLVGTRPPLIDEWEQYDLHHRARMSIRPGLTGLWQVSGRSDIKDFEEVIALDMQYINNWSIMEDIRIILMTVKVLFTGDGAK